MKLQLEPTPYIQSTSINLPASKSESNRALIIQALSQYHINLQNISNARDTQTMLRLLQSAAYELDVLDAGTTMRFLTAFCTVSNRKTLLTGTLRMQERPIKLLVDALNTLGGTITYQKNQGFPPILISDDFTQRTNTISIPGNISSQYISALLLIAPVLPKGLKIQLENEVSSRPYIEMTLALMALFGAKHQWIDNTITVEPGGYTLQSTYTIESDWSAASYWFSMVAMAEKAEITLPWLKKASLQGDSAIVGIMEKLGVTTTWQDEGLTLSKNDKRVEVLEQDFLDCPDIAQTVAVCCAALGVKGKFSGLHSLRIKETDRIAALQNELAKVGATFTEINENLWTLEPANSLPKEVSIHTYEDHRMAMAFAPLATKMKVIIEDPKVVEKSYPHFWEDIEKAGIKTSVI